MTLHPSHDELHDWSRDQHGAASKKSAWLTQERLWMGLAMIVGAITFAVIFGQQIADLINETTARPASCADYHGAECIAAVSEGYRE